MTHLCGSHGADSHGCSSTSAAVQTFTDDDCHSRGPLTTLRRLFNCTQYYSPMSTFTRLRCSGAHEALDPENLGGPLRWTSEENIH